MTSKQIEDIAVSSVSLYFSRAKCVSPFISNNDKEPCWDGNLYIYNDEKKNVNSLIGKIPVQVKGKLYKENLTKDEIKYTVSCVNLKNYMRDGGIVYFVVAEFNNSTKIYYSKLTPLILKKYVNQCNGKQSISIKLYALSSYTDDIDYEFRDFYTDCRKQTGNIDETIRLEDLSNSSSEFNITFFASGLNPNRQSIPEYLSKHSVYLYVKTTDSFNLKCLRPIGDGPFTLKVVESVSADIIVDGIVYYKNFKRMYSSSGNVIIHIGESLKMEFPPEGSKTQTKVNFSLQEKDLSSWINDARFILAMIRTGKLLVNGCELCLTPQNDESFTKWCHNRLSYAEQIKCLLDNLHVNKELRLKQFDDKEERLLNTLFLAVNKMQEVSIHEDLPPVFTVNISNLCIALSAIKTPSGKYRINTYKLLPDPVYYTDNTTEEPLETSIYSWFQEEGFNDVSNIDYADILPSYQKLLLKNPKIPQRANNDMLMMILAYDKGKDKRMLYCAYDICKWLDSICGDKDNQYTYRINMMQIIKRQRELTQEEKSEIIDMIEHVDHMGKAACYILLDNESFACHHLSKLNSNEASFFKSLPIFRLFSSTKNV